MEYALPGPSHGGSGAITSIREEGDVEAMMMPGGELFQASTSGSGRQYLQQKNGRRNALPGVTNQRTDFDTFRDLPLLLPQQKQGGRLAQLRRGRVIGYCLSLLAIGTLVLVILVFIVFQPTASGPNPVPVNQYCASDELVECQQRLRAQLNTDGAGVLRSPVHLLFTFLAFTVVTIAFAILHGVRESQKRKQIERLPGHSVDLWQLTWQSGSRGSDYRARCFSKSMFLSITDEFQRVAVLQRLCESLPQKLGQPSGDPNWGKSDNGVAYHFKDAIAVSFKSLEDAAVHYDAELSFRPNETVRDFVERIKRRCPTINHEICDRYVATYEEAKFGRKSFNQQMYDSFLTDTFYYLLKTLYVKQPDS